MAGKGSGRRPAAISQAELDRRWAEAFEGSRAAPCGDEPAPRWRSSRPTVRPGRKAAEAAREIGQLELPLE